MDTPQRFKELEARAWRFSQTRSGHVLFLLALSLVWTYLWAVMDVFVVRLAFPAPLGPAQRTDLYWLAMWDIIFPTATLLAFREHAWFPIAASALGSWEDILFYFALGVPVPQDVSWIAYTPTAELLYLRGLLLPLIAIVAEVITHPLPLRRRMAALWGGILVLGYFLNSAFVALFALPAMLYLLYANSPEILRTLDRTWRPLRRRGM